MQMFPLIQCDIKCDLFLCGQKDHLQYNPQTVLDCPPITVASMLIPSLLVLQLLPVLSPFEVF